MSKMVKYGGLGVLVGVVVGVVIDYNNCGKGVLIGVVVVGVVVVGYGYYVDK